MYEPRSSLSDRALRLPQVIPVVAMAFIIFGYNWKLVPLATLRSRVKILAHIDTVNTHGAVKAKNSTGKGAVIAAFQIGALMGALSCTFISDRLGRRKAIFCGAILNIVGQLLQVSAYSLIPFTVGRIILGMALDSSLCPFGNPSALLRRIAASMLLPTVSSCAWDMRFAIGSILDSAGSHMRPPDNVGPTRYIILLVARHSGLYLLLPESPRWLVRVNRVDEASASLAAYKGVDPIR